MAIGFLGFNVYKNVQWYMVQESRLFLHDFIVKKETPFLAVSDFVKISKCRFCFRLLLWSQHVCNVSKPPLETALLH